MILDPEGDDGDEDCFDIHPEAWKPPRLQVPEHERETWLEF